MKLEDVLFEAIVWTARIIPGILAGSVVTFVLFLLMRGLMSL